MSKNHPTLADQLRQIIDGSGMTRYEIAKAAKIDHATMSRFYTGERGLSMDTLEALAEVLEIKIVSGIQPSPNGSDGESKTNKRTRKSNSKRSK